MSKEKSLYNRVLPKCTASNCVYNNHKCFCRSIYFLKKAKGVFIFLEPFLRSLCESAVKAKAGPSSDKSKAAKSVTSISWRCGRLNWFTLMKGKKLKNTLYSPITLLLRMTRAVQPCVTTAVLFWCYCLWLNGLCNRKVISLQRGPWDAIIVEGCDCWAGCIALITQDWPKWNTFQKRKVARNERK